MTKGFTLIEILVVVLIIGILAAIAVPQYQKAVLKSQYATMKDIVRVVSEAEQRYYLANGKYTTDFNDLDITYPLQSVHVLKFKGGHCGIHWWGNPYEGITCYTDSTPTIQLEYFYRSATKRCRVGPIDGNSLPDKICQLETGKITPDIEEKSTNSSMYYY